MLEGVRKTRNQLAHFKEDDITALQRDQLHVCADWLADHDKDAKDAFSKSADKIREVLY
jgi:hypothetical protein